MHRTAGFALLLGVALVAITYRFFFLTARKLADLALADGAARPTGGRTPSTRRL